jgi:flagellar secretion chaperone FliS
MFSPHVTSSFGPVTGMAGAYRRVGIETSVESASPHRLVALLFDGYMEARPSAARRASSKRA